jgi:hypothetical protein
MSKAEALTATKQTIDRSIRYPLAATAKGMQGDPDLPVKTG